jgi:hypothetical protein
VLMLCRHRAVGLDRRAGAQHAGTGGPEGHGPCLDQPGPRIISGRLWSSGLTVWRRGGAGADGRRGCAARDGVGGALGALLGASLGAIGTALGTGSGAGIAGAGVGRRGRGRPASWRRDRRWLPLGAGTT